MVPATTNAEKLKRREKTKHQGQRSGRKFRPLPPPCQGTDEQFKEFRTVTFYDETGGHWHEQPTRGNWPPPAPLERHEKKRLRFSAADEKIANIDGATDIYNQPTARPHDLPLDSLGLDFYQLVENVHKSRQIVYGEDSETSTARLTGRGRH